MQVSKPSSKEGKGRRQREIFTHILATATCPSTGIPNAKGKAILSTQWAKYIPHCSAAAPGKARWVILNDEYFPKVVGFFFLPLPLQRHHIMLAQASKTSSSFTIRGAGSLALWSLSQRLKTLRMFSGKRKKEKKKPKQHSDKRSQNPSAWLRSAIENLQRQHPSPPLHRKGRTIAVLRVWKRSHLSLPVSALHIQDPPQDPGWLLAAPTAETLPTPSGTHLPARPTAGAEGLTPCAPLPFQPQLLLCHSRDGQAKAQWQHKGNSAHRQHPTFCKGRVDAGRGGALECARTILVWISRERVVVFSPLTFANLL